MASTFCIASSTGVVVRGGIIMDMCVCGWRGQSFDQHHEETKFEDATHVETSPLMEIFRPNHPF